jgi:hypothetical protein
MRWFWFAFFRLLPVAVVVAVTLAMRAALSPWLAWLATFGVGALLAALGALVLRTTKVGELTWKNRLAGHLLPWGYHIGGGSLLGIVLGCVVAWAALAGAVLVSSAPALAPDQATAAAANQPAAASASTSPWLLLAWVLAGAFSLWLFGQLRKFHQPGSSVTRSQGRLLLVVAALLVGSVVLHRLGHSEIALLVVGGPMLVVGGGYGLFLGAILVFGRNARWN